MPEPKTAFHDVPLSDFPFDILFIGTATGRTLHEIHIDGPGAVTIPGQDELSEPVDVEMRFPDGRWVRVAPNGEESYGRS